MTSMTSPQLQRKFGDKSGRLGSLNAVSMLYLPESVRLERGRIYCKYNDLHGDRLKSPDPIILNKFIDLRERSDGDVCKFVRDYGPLFLCEEHDLPWSRAHFLRFEKCLRAEVVLLVEAERSRRTSDSIEFSEPAAQYRKFAMEVFKMLSCALILRNGAEPKEDDWPDKAVGGVDKSVSGYKRLAKHLNWWIETAGLEQWVVPRGDPPVGVRFELVSDAINPLFGVIALQLAGALCGGSGTSLCAECSKIYIAHRRLRPGRSGYCSECGIKAAWRKASAKLRRKRKRERRSPGGSDTPRER